MFDIKLEDGTVVGECCAEHYGDVPSTPYRMQSYDVCDYCGWGPANESPRDYEEVDLSEFVDDYSEIYA